ncbi:unnamed protein product [Boreogadus saida]
MVTAPLTCRPTHPIVQHSDPGRSQASPCCIHTSSSLQHELHGPHAYYVPAAFRKVRAILQDSLPPGFQTQMPDPHLQPGFDTRGRLVRTAGILWRRSEKEILQTLNEPLRPVYIDRCAPELHNLKPGGGSQRAAPGAKAWRAAVGEH